ncbi:PAS domain-containing protein, partial [Acinetobacter baumannii]
PSVLEVLGFQPAEVVGQSCLALIEKNSPEATEIARFVSGHDAKDQLETTVKTKSGKSIDMLLSLSYVNREENCILIFHDITELKKAERFKQ